MKKTVLLLAAGAPYHRHIDALHRAGYRVAAMDRDPAAPGLALADDHRVGSIAEEGEVTQAARDLHVDAIVAATEIGVVPAAVASDNLGLPGISPAVARATTHKPTMRTRWREAGLPQPAFTTAGTPEEARSALLHLGLPAVIKPAASAASKGVSVVATAADIDLAIDDAFALPDGCVIVEQFVAGQLLTAEGFVGDAEARVAIIGDVDTQAVDRHRVNMTLAYPGAFPEATLARARNLIERAANAVGLRRSPFHCECIVRDDGEIHLVEIGARGGGGHIFSTLYAPMLGASGIVHQVRLLLGETNEVVPDLSPGGGCYMFLSAPGGRFLRAEGVEVAASLPGVIDLGMSIRPSDPGGRVTNDNARHGHIVAVGRDRDEAWRNAAAARDAIRFVMAHDTAQHSAT